MINVKQLTDDLTNIIEDVIEQSHINEGDIFVLGCSSSEIVGGVIGKQSSEEVGKLVIETLLPILTARGIHLAVQGCEHINRALTVERQTAAAHRLDIVSVVPALHAGGACSVAAFRQMNDPVVVEFVTAKAGLDIGDTAIGMHIKHVQIPIRPVKQELGGAHVTALTSRPKLIGGERAVYQ